MNMQCVEYAGGEVLDSANFRVEDIGVDSANFRVEDIGVGIWDMQRWVKVCVCVCGG